MGMALLIWMLGIAASVLAIAYIVITAFLLAAKRRMATPAVSRTSATTRLSRMPGMRYRTQ